MVLLFSVMASKISVYGIVLAWLRSEQILNDMLLQFEFSIVVKTLNLELEQIVDEL